MHRKSIGAIDMSIEERISKRGAKLGLFGSCFCFLEVPICKPAKKWTR